MIDPVQVLWSPRGVTLPSLGTRALADVHDGDTPSIKMPIRMLSMDTPEITAETAQGAAKVDEEFSQLAEWINQGTAPISHDLAAFLLPKLETGRAGTLQFEQGTAAAAFAKEDFDKRLARPHGRPRSLFLRVTETPFDDHSRLLAYLAPNYSEQEREELTRAQRSTFNLDMVAAGWAAPFVIYPSVPGELDLPLLLAAAEKAVHAKRGIWGNPETLLAYEYRAVEKLFAVTKKIVDGTPLQKGERTSWRSRYCVDMRTRVLHGPEDYFRVDPVYRLWIWPKDVQEATGRLNLQPSERLARGE